MKQNISIRVRKKPVNEGIVSCRAVTVREKLLSFLLGSPQRVTVIVPGANVDEIAITEHEERMQFNEAIRSQAVY